MATSYNSAPELATDFEQWFARKVKGSVSPPLKDMKSLANC